MKQTYRFIYRTECGEYVDVRHGCRPGDAENMARRLAREVARRLGESTVTCIWMRPEEIPLTRKLIEEARA